VEPAQNGQAAITPPNGIAGEMAISTPTTTTVRQDVVANPSYVRLIRCLDAGLRPNG